MLEQYLTGIAYESLKQAKTSLSIKRNKEITNIKDCKYFIIQIYHSRI